MSLPASDVPGPVRVATLRQFRLGHRPCLDGLRGVAVVVVMLHHAFIPFTKGGGIGVDIFFVLSGFLITALLVQEWEHSSTISLQKFYARRLLRLAPALILFLLFVEAYILLFIHGDYFWKLQKAVLAALCYFGNWMRATQLTSMGPLAHTWSLSVEEQFYLIWPPMLFIFLRCLEKRSILAIVSTLILGVSLHRIALWSGDPSWGRIYNGTDTRIDELLAGALGALLISAGFLAQTLRRWISKAGYMPALLLVPYLIVRPLKPQMMCWFGFSLIELTVVSLIFFLMLSPPTIVHRCLESRVAIGIGRISYGLYLWHFPIFGILGSLHIPVLLKLSVMFGLATSTSVLSYFLVERRFLAMKIKLGGTPPVVPLLRLAS